jgi:SAM-dependent methyltransferase
VIETLHRLFNGVRKVAAGLRPFSESVWPGVRNDLFVAHESIYAFASQYARGRIVLDAGCGTGYGAEILAGAEATRVIGVDLDPRNVAFARRRYPRANLSFEIGDLERLPFDGAQFGLVIASNSLEHLESPGAFLDSLRRMLTPDGVAIIAVPPIYSEHDYAKHQAIHYHRSNLPMPEWARLIAAHGFRATGCIHNVKRTADLTSHRRSRLTVADFTFTPVPVEEMLQRFTITGIFVVERA